MMSDSRAHVFGVDIRFFAKHAAVLPHHYTSAETNRMTLAFFCVCGLDLLGALDSEAPPQRRADWTAWIYAHQIHPSLQFPAESGLCGFRGSLFFGAPFDPVKSLPIHVGDAAHITMTYTALAVLITLGDDLSRVDSNSIIQSLRRLQSPDGSFRPTVDSHEKDMRFLYCACAISYIFSDWRGVDKDKAIEFIQSSLAFDGAYGQGPGQESHGGSTYCAIASLWLMDRLSVIEPHKQATISWLLSRYVTGFQGRVNKPADTCYAFWIGASLDMLDAYTRFIDTAPLYSFLEETHSSYGGYGKVPDAYPDIMHSYLGFAGRAIARDPLVERLFAPLNITERAIKHWRFLGGGKIVS